MDYQIFFETSLIPAAEYINGYRDEKKFISFCKRCRSYNHNWSCPPYDFDPGERISGFKNVYLIGSRIIPGKSLTEKHDRLEDSRPLVREILNHVRNSLDSRLLLLEEKYPESLAFFAGSCCHCPHNHCSRPSGSVCIRPDRMRYSLESFGFDIGRTARDLLHIEIKWAQDGKLPEYFILVSALFTNNDTIDVQWE